MKLAHTTHRALLAAALILSVTAPTAAQHTHILNQRRLARQNFGNEASWYAANIPFLEIDDPEIQRVYYYRWKLYRAHIREIGVQGTDETEFLGNVPWARQPYTDLNDSSSFHILEGRWLRNRAFVTSLVDHLYSGGGNDRHFSEFVAAATFAWTQATGDPTPALRHLDTMEHVYNLWDDHFDSTRNLYWIEPLLDATEYSIASIDASGAGFTDAPSSRDNENGFTGGFAYRPSINAYQFANAQAISALAAISHQPAVAADYAERAERIRRAVLDQLWNSEFQHFTDVYQRSTPSVTAGDFIRGRELIGYVPWMFELPPHASDTLSAWKHVLDQHELSGPYGLRTAEPSYPHYLQQYRYDSSTGLPECQWNGPSWPFQTSQVLTAMANLLHDYTQTVVSPDDYLRLFRQFTHQHFLADGTLDLQEDYNPDTGAPIVGLPRSHHYNHSAYVDLLVTGLIGLRPRSDNILELAPLLSSSAAKPIRYFALEDLPYHGHNLTIAYDADGQRYHLGRGLSVFSDGTRISGPAPLRHIRVPLAQSKPSPVHIPVDLAVNVYEHAHPDSPSITTSDDTLQAHPYEAIDGRAWPFPEIPNGWSPKECVATAKVEGPGCWLRLDFRRRKLIRSIHLVFLAYAQYQPPRAVTVERETDRGWRAIGDEIVTGASLTLAFPVTEAQQLRFIFSPPSLGAKLRVDEIEVFGCERGASDCGRQPVDHLRRASR